MVSRPRSGDVLVSRSIGRTEHRVSIVPDGSPTTHTTCDTHDRAIAAARDLAERLHVDVWLTEDNLHFLRVASYRHD